METPATPPQPTIDELEAAIAAGHDVAIAPDGHATITAHAVETGEPLAIPKAKTYY